MSSEPGAGQLARRQTKRNSGHLAPNEPSNHRHVNRALLFLGRRLKDYQDSRLNAVAYAFNLVLLLIFTVASYTAINLALYKLDTQQFTLVSGASPFLFLYYSFHVFLFNGIAEVAATGLYSQILSMTEQLFAIVLLFILIVLFFSVRSESTRKNFPSQFVRRKRVGAHSTS